MFTIRCTTCDSKLAVKNEELIGQILSCPKCGGMVLVQKPDDDLEFDVVNVPEPSKKRFPDTLTSETDSGIISEDALVKVKNHLVAKTSETSSPITSQEDFPADSTPVSSSHEFHASPPPIPVETLTEEQLRTRKILLGILVGLVAFLLLALGVLIAVKGNGSDDETRPNPSPSVAVDSTDVDSIPFEKKQPEAPEFPESSKSSTNDNSVQNTPIQNTAPSDVIATKSSTVTDESNAPDSSTKQSETIKEKPASDTETNDTTEDKQDDKQSERLAELLRQDAAYPGTETIPDENMSKSPEPVEVRSATDLLSRLEQKLPGLIEPSAAFSVDVSARLRLPLAELKLHETPLIDFFRTVSSLTEVPISLDVDEFYCRGISIDKPLTGNFGPATVGEILAKVLQPLNLEPVIEDRQITVTMFPDRRDKLSDKNIDVSDLIRQTAGAADLRGRPDPNGHLTAQRLAEILERLVDPVDFRSNNNNAGPSLKIQDDGSLAVRHRFRMLDETLRILEQLRVIRGLKQQTEAVGEDLAPEAFGWDAVMKPMTLNYYQPTPLDGVLKQIETATGLRILVDHRSLHRALSPLGSMRATVRCNNGTVDEALEKLLASVDVAMLTYRIIRHDVLEITTVDSAESPEKTSIEVHRYETPDRLLGATETPEALVETIKTVLEPNHWFRPEDPETRGLGDIVIDRPSGCLIVRQTQPVQRRIRLWLGNRLSESSIEKQPGETVAEER